MKRRFVFMAVFRGGERLFGPWHSELGAKQAAGRFARRFKRAGMNVPITYVLELDPGPSAPATAKRIIELAGGSQ
jgi:hypothetical protein